MKKLTLLIFGVGFLAAEVSGAGFDVSVKRPGGEVVVKAEARGSRIFIDLVQAAGALGGRMSLKDGEYVMEFSSGTATVNPQTGLYRLRPLGEKRWKVAALEGPPHYSGPRFFISLDDLPLIAFRRLTYHLQKRELAETSEVQAFDWGDLRAVPARKIESGGKEWFSLEDAAQALGVVVYSPRPKRYSLVMPDFSILEVEGLKASRRGGVVSTLDEPVLLYSGAPYLTLSSLSVLFSVEIRWDAVNKALLVPKRYGRGKESAAVEKPPLTVVGYRPQSLSLTVDEATLFYQDPGPSYGYDHPDVYESVRDFFTNQPRRPPTAGYDRVSGSTAFTVKGSGLSQPLEGGGHFEKVGTRGRVVDGSLQWGFPRLRLKAAREYVKMGSLYNQYDAVDELELSHSNDSFGEGDKSFTWQARALQGQQLFSVFSSTEFFTQSVNYRQTVSGGALEGAWKTADRRQTFSTSLSFYRFLNHVRQLLPDYNLLGDLLGSGFLVDVDPLQSQALAGQVLTDRHDTAVADVLYRVSDIGQLNATAGGSRYRDGSAKETVRDGDWRLGGTWGEKHSRMTASFEKVGPRYRSLGDPTRYQGRSVMRLAPYLDLARFWKVYGEFRREDVQAQPQTDSPAYRNDFLYVANTFFFPTRDLRLLANKSDHTTYGKRWSASADSTRYYGRDSLDLGVSWSNQWLPTGVLYKQAYTGRFNWQILRPGGKLSVGEELTRDHYPFYKLELWKAVTPQFPSRWESATHFVVQKGLWESALQYNFAPRFYRESEILYTGYFRVGYKVARQKVVNVFYATSALNQNLSGTQVWRAGVEYVNDFF